MEDTFSRLKDYEKSLPKFDNLELGLLDYQNIEYNNVRLLNKIFLSLIYNPLVYESSVRERVRNWLVNPQPLGEEIQHYPNSAGIIAASFVVGCLSASPAYSLQAIWEPSRDILTQHVISKSILYLDLGIPNFFAQFAILPFEPVRNEHWYRVEKGEKKKSVSSVVTQVYPSEPYLLRNLLLNFNSNYPAIVTCFVEIFFALLHLYQVSAGKLFPSSVTVDDIIVTSTESTEKPLINYGKYGIINTHGVIAFINNYQNFEGSVSFGKSSYPIRFDKSPRQPAEEGVLGEFANSILRSQTNPGLLRDEAAEFYSRLKTFWGRMYYTEIKDAMVVFEEEFSALSIIKDIWIPTAPSTVTRKRRITGPHVSFADAYKWWPTAAPIRLAYTDSEEAILINEAINSLNDMQLRYYKALLAGARQTRLNNRDFDQRRQGLVIAIIALDNFGSLIRLLTYLSPDSPSIARLTNLLNNNWNAIKILLRPDVSKKVKQSLFD